MLSLIDVLRLVQQNRCFHCGTEMTFIWSICPTNATREHVVPRSHKRKLANNIVLAHRICNESRGNREATAKEIERADAIYIALGCVKACVDGDKGHRTWCGSNGWSGKTVNILAMLA